MFIKAIKAIYTFSKNSSQLFLLGRGIRIFIFGLILFGLYQELSHQPEALAQTLQIWSSPQLLGILLLALLFMPLNWGLEALKWKTLSAQHIPITFGQAYRGVLRGIGLSLAGPRFLTEYFGRVSIIDPQKKIASAGALWAGNMAQFSITLLAGTLGFIYHFPNPLANTFLPLFGLLTVLVFSFYFFGKQTLQLLYPIKSFSIYPTLQPWVIKLKPFLKASFEQPSNILWQALAWAALRYVVYTLQWLIILWAVAPTFHLGELMACIAQIFVLKSAIPTLHLVSDLGVREFLALKIMQPIGLNASQILAVTLSVWLLNVLLPSLVGSLFWLRGPVWAKRLQAEQ